MLSKFSPTRTGFDFDGVIADTVEAFLRIACKDHGYCGIRAEDITNFCVEECISIPQNVLSSIFHYLTEKPVEAGLLPMAGALQALKRLSYFGTVVIVTARPKADPVVNWLTHVGGHTFSTGIEVVAVGDHDDKERFIRQTGLSSFIDDRAETCADLRKKGIDARVFTQPWNQMRQDLPRVGSWEEICQLCLS